jgi:UDPglucose 6-dehydrogenase
MKIGIIGTGYIGLTEGLCFASLGQKVICYDIIKEKIDQLNKGIPTLYEENIDVLLKDNLEKKSITFTDDLKVVLSGSEIVFLCVNTPENPETGECDLSQIMTSTESISKMSETLGNKFFILAVRSTVPVGTNKKIKEHMLKINPKLNFLICSNPEFSRQGSAIYDFMNPDRVIVGVDNEKSKERMGLVYKPLTDKGFPIFFTNIETAEMIKYASNTFLNIKIGFINEICDICELTGANVEDIGKAMGMDKRISPLFLKPGPGIGGSCFPKDSIALAKMGNKLGLDLQIINASVNSNISRKNSLASRVINYSKNKLEGKTISLLGLTFKANTDDTRYSPALNLVEELAKKNIKVNAYDPHGTDKFKYMVDPKALDFIRFFDNAYDAIKDTELLVIITEWDEYKHLDYKKIYDMVQQKIIVDFRKILDEQEMEKIGFKYFYIGKRKK